MNKLILDTSIFTNPQTYKKWGITSIEALCVFIDIYKNDFELYITPSCFEELNNFAEITKLGNKLIHLNIKQPNRKELNINADLVFELLTDFRKRGDQALQYSIKEIGNTFIEGTKCKVKEKNQKEMIDKNCGVLIKRLREKHRHYLRENFIDSGADFDTLLLAQELNGKIVTADNGIKNWTDKMGIVRLHF